MKPPAGTSSPRLPIVDALRGFALLAIVLLHGLEHYNLFYFPDVAPWLTTLDKGVWDTLFFLFAGKAYATFSLLFGFSFYIQYRNEEQRGGDFRWRFVWRLVLLLLIAQLHALFYNGDILVLYAVVGLSLLPVAPLRDKTVLIIALVCLLQPVEWIRFFYGMAHPDWPSYGNYFMAYADRAYPAMLNGNFIDTLRSNIWDGQLYSNLWQVEHGRLFQAAALFMLGMLLGHKHYFVKSDLSIRRWKQILVLSLLTFVPLYFFKTYIPPLILPSTARAAIDIILPSLSNLAFTGVLVSAFCLAWFKKEGYGWQRLLAPYGRMSLTNYIGQSIIGVTLYWGFGFGLYQYTGATATLLIGLVTVALQLLFSRYWLAHHKQGPLEYLWKKGTWIGRLNT